MLRFTVVDVPADVRAEARAHAESVTFDDPGPLEAEALRASYWVTNQPVPGDGLAIDETIAGVRCRVVRPDEPRAVYLHVHGGGFVLGEPADQDRQLEGIAAKTGAAVVSVAYRLAPEHPYPAGLDDCEAVAHALLDDDGLAGLPFLIGGESAGANLAVATLLRLRDDDRHNRFVAANLVNGVFTTGSLPSREAWGDRYTVLSLPLMSFFHEAYGGDPLDPLASPLVADLADLPPALFTVGTEDPLLDDSLLMANRWAMAGSHAELEVWPDGVHAFDGLPTRLGTMVRRRLGAWLADRVAAGGRDG